MNKEQLSKIYLKYRFYIFPVIIVVTSLVLIVFVIYPQSMALVNGFGELQQKSNKLQVLKLKASDLEGLNEIELTQKINILLTALPSDKEYPSLIGVLKGLGSQLGITLSSIQIGQAVSTSNSGSSFIVNLEITAPQTLISRLATSIESSPRVMKVRSIDLSYNKSTNLVNGIFVLDVYFVPLPTTIGSAESPLPKLSEKDQQTIDNFTRSTPSLSQSSIPATVSARGKVNPFE